MSFSPMMSPPQPVSLLPRAAFLCLRKEAAPRLAPCPAPLGLSRGLWDPFLTMSAGHCPPWCGGDTRPGVLHVPPPPNLTARPPTSGCFAAVVVPPHSISRHPTPNPSDCPKLQPVASNQQQTKRSSLTTREGFQQATTSHPCPPSPARWASLPAPPHSTTQTPRLLQQHPRVQPTKL